MLQTRKYRPKHQPRRILVISMRYLGDVLLTTPLLHAIKRAYPDCRLDVLALLRSSAMLEGNPDVDQVISVPEHGGLRENLGLIKRLFRHYDIAFITETGDRRYFYGWLAAPVRYGFIPAHHQKGHWKHLLAQGWVEDDSENSHRVLEFLRLASLLKIPPCYSLTPPRPVNEQDRNVVDLFYLPQNFAVLHPYPQWNYKQWPREHWISMTAFLLNKGISVVLSAGPGEAEMDYVNNIHQALNQKSINLAGKTTLAQLTEVLSRARLYIGPDTGTTHLAAACKIPVITLYGPTNPIRWAPWPADYCKPDNPFKRTGSQHVNNVFLIQGEADCVPCGQEGCDRHRNSHSRCLDTLPPERIWQVIDEILQQA